MAGEIHYNKHGSLVYDDGTMDYDELVQRMNITRSYLANHPTHGSWEEANVVEQAADAITKLRAERDFAMEMVNVQDNQIDALRALLKRQQIVGIQPGSWTTLSDADIEAALKDKPDRKSVV